MLHAVVLTQYRRVMDGQTDGIAVASTALAKRHAVKMGGWWRWALVSPDGVGPSQMVCVSTC